MATPEEIRRKSIRYIAGTRVREVILGHEQGDDALVFKLIDLMQAIVGLAMDLRTKGVMANPDFNQDLRDLFLDLQTYQDVRQAARDAIQNGDTVAQAQAAIDAIIPPP